MPDQLSTRALASLKRARQESERKKVLAHLDRALTADPACAPALLHRAALFLISAEHRRARIDFERLTALPAAGLLVYGEFDVPSPPPTKLLPVVCRFLDATPEAAWAWALKAFMLRQLFRYEEAVDAIEEAIRSRGGPMDPSDDGRVQRSVAGPESP